MNQIKRARLRKGYSLSALAKAAGVSYATLWRLEEGGVTPHRRTIERVVEALNNLPSLPIIT